jgi:hypothetical protein
MVFSFRIYQKWTGSANCISFWRHPASFSSNSAVWIGAPPDSIFLQVFVPRVYVAVCRHTTWSTRITHFYACAIKQTVTKLPVKLTPFVGYSDLSGENLIKFSGAFAKLRKAIIIFVMSVSPSIRLRGITRHPLDGFSFNLLSIVRNSVAKIQV